MYEDKLLGWDWAETF